MIPKKLEKMKESPKFLMESGLLWYINREILHPLGLALEIEVSENGEIVFGELWDYRDDPEGILYDEENLVEGHKRYMRFKSSFADKKRMQRKQSLGYIIQPLEKNKDDKIEV